MDYYHGAPQGIIALDYGLGRPAHAIDLGNGESSWDFQNQVSKEDRRVDDGLLEETPS